MCLVGSAGLRGLGVVEQLDASRAAVDETGEVIEDGPAAAIATMSGLGVWWAFAGGWAIDLWLGEQTREHHDVEVAVRRVDRAVLWDGLQRCHELACIDPPGS